MALSSVAAIMYYGGKYNSSDKLEHKLIYEF